MITLREFLKMIRDVQYRIYQPNRDCLIFESYFTVHTPYFFDERYEKNGEWFNTKYYDDNDYCRGVYTDAYKNPAYDEETSIFLDRFGDYEVFNVEYSSCMPTRMYKGEDGGLKFEHNVDGHDWVPCFNIFIASYNKEHIRECDRCTHSLLKPDPEDRNGCSRFPDPKDAECKQCWRYILNRPKGGRG